MIKLHRCTFGDDFNMLWLAITIENKYYIIAQLDGPIATSSNAWFFNLVYNLNDATVNEIL